MASNLSIERISDIEISRIYKVYCCDHGYIDEVKTYVDALEARKEHYLAEHKTSPSAT